jgi:hypothetical protein
MIDGGQQTADGRRRTAVELVETKYSRRQIADDGRQRTDDIHQQPTTNNQQL